MKHLIALLAIAASNLAFAQNLFESPYVNEGQSFTFVIPDAFGETLMSNTEYSMYVTDLERVMRDLPTDLLMLGQTMDIEGITNEDLISQYDELDLEILSEVQGAKVEVFTTRNGEKFLMAKGKVDDFGDELTDVYFGMRMFGEVMITAAFIDFQEDDTMDPSILKAVLQSYSEVQTDRENEFNAYEEEALEDDPSFRNEQYDTNLSCDFMDLDPEFTPEDESEGPHLYWEEDWREDYPELLLAYFYTSSHGANGYAGIKIFSGGLDNYSSGLKKLSAVQKVFPDHNISGLTNEEVTVKGNMFEFEKYSVQSSNEEFGTEVLYVTKIQDETVFVLGYHKEAPYKVTETELEKVVITLLYQQ